MNFITCGLLPTDLCGDLWGLPRCCHRCPGWPAESGSWLPDWCRPRSSWWARASWKYLEFGHILHWSCQGLDSDRALGRESLGFCPSCGRKSWPWLTWTRNNLKLNSMSFDWNWSKREEKWEKKRRWMIQYHILINYSNDFWLPGPGLGLSWKAVFRAMAAATKYEENCRIMKSVSSCL